MDCVEGPGCLARSTSMVPVGSWHILYCQLCLVSLVSLQKETASRHLDQGTKTRKQSRKVSKLTV